MHKKIHKIEFPKDENAHKSIIEWWYFNGFLKDKNNNEYVFMDCFFKADAEKVGIPFLVKSPLKTIHFAHSLLSNLKTKKTYKTINHLVHVSKDSFKRPFLFINYTNPFSITEYENYTIEELELFKYRIKSPNFDLNMTSNKKPMLEGGKGYLTIADKGSYYYSLTDLSIKGLIKINGKYIEVSGKGWMDHQWANVKYTKDKWSWFSIQLNNGTDIMCCEYKKDKEKTHIVDIISKNKHESLNNLVLTPSSSKYWESPLTKAKYPLEWHIKIPSKKIDLFVSALIKDQEMVYGKINYWEGPLKISGVVNGKKVEGQGFMELVGYDSNYSNFSLITDEIKEFLSDSMKKSGKRVMKTLKRL